MDSRFGFAGPHQHNRLYTRKSDKQGTGLLSTHPGKFTLQFCRLDPRQFSNSAVRSYNCMYSRSKFDAISYFTENIGSGLELLVDIASLV